MTASEKIDKVWNEIKKFPKYIGPDCVTFFEMNNYTFVVKEDVAKLWKEDFAWVKNDHGHIGDYRAIRFEKFDPNDIDNYFDDLLFRGYMPIRIIVKPDYWTENAYIRSENQSRQH